MNVLQTPQNNLLIGPFKSYLDRRHEIDKNYALLGLKDTISEIKEANNKLLRDIRNIKIDDILS